HLQVHYLRVHLFFQRQERGRVAVIYGQHFFKGRNTAGDLDNAKSDPALDQIVVGGRGQKTVFDFFVNIPVEVDQFTGHRVYLTFLNVDNSRAEGAELEIISKCGPAENISLQSE